MQTPYVVSDIENRRGGGPQYEAAYGLILRLPRPVSPTSIGELYD
jgi:hypothetical protein